MLSCDINTNLLDKLIDRHETHQAGHEGPWSCEDTGAAQAEQVVAKAAQAAAQAAKLAEQEINRLKHEVDVLKKEKRGLVQRCSASEREVASVKVNSSACSVYTGCQFSGHAAPLAGHPWLFICFDVVSRKPSVLRARCIVPLQIISTSMSALF